MFCQRSKMNKIILEIFVKNLSDGIETFCSWMRRLRPGEIESFAHHLAACRQQQKLKPNALLYSIMFFSLQIGSCL